MEEEMISTYTAIMKWLDSFFVQSAIESMISILFVFIVTYVCWKVVKRLIKKHLQNRNKDIILKITKIVIWTIGILIATRQIKALQDLAFVLFSSSGVVVVVLGLSAQEAIGNIISGVLIAWNKPFEVGDYIRCVDNNAEGYVQEIALRHTILRTFENHVFVVPNSKLSASVIENYTKAGKQCVFLDIGISYDSNLTQAMEIMKKIASEHPLFYDTRTPQQIQEHKEAITIRVQELGEYAIQLRAILWVRSFDQKAQLLSDLRKDIKLAFDKANIEIPYPYQNQIVKIHTEL